MSETMRIRFNPPWTLMVALLALSMSFSVSGEDIDIYGNPAANAVNPNVLIIIDNSTNWASNTQHWEPSGTKQGEAELNSLRTLATEFGDDINVGLMMFTKTGIQGGYARFGIRTMNATNRAAFQELIGTSSCADGANSLNGTPNCLYKNFQDPSEKESQSTIDISAAMFEAYKYFGGYTSPAHANDDVAGTPTDASHFGPYRYAGAPDAKTDAGAFTSNTKEMYNLNLASCAKNYIVYIGNGAPGADSPASLLSGVGGDTTQLPMPDYDLVTTTTSADEGSTDLCYSSAASVPAGDYPPSCANYASPDYCSVGTAIANTAATACPSGTASYPVLGNIPGQAAVPNASHTITGTVQGSGGTASHFTITAAGHRFAVGSTVTISGCPVGNSAAKTLNGVHTVNTSTPASNTFKITDGNNNAPACTTGTVVGTDAEIAASTVTLGYSRCLSTCDTDDFDNVCGSGKTYATCSCSTPTVSTSPVCASGNKFNIRNNLVATTLEPLGTGSIPTGSAINYADEWAKFLDQADVSSLPGQQSVTTYTVDVYKDHPDAGATALMQNMAFQGGGRYFQAQNEAEILKALRTIMSEVQSVNSVFASASLPVSVNAQGTYLNQILIGMFRPQGAGKPRWAGNLKQFHIGKTTDIFLADKNGNPAISPISGFITPCAESFWGSDTGNYWNYGATEAKGSCKAVSSQFPVAGSSSLYSDVPDGEVVEKGGAAQHLRGVMSSGGTLTSSATSYATRVLKTCSASSCTALTDFDSANAAITASDLGVDASQRDDLIDWVRGRDVYDENVNVFYDEVRPSVHGDVVHSQPGVIDYGGSTGVVAFYGSNDGVLHAVNANKTGTGGGTEIWGFIAPETYGRLKRQARNEPYVKMPGVLESLSPVAKDYFFDGSFGIYQKSGTVWIFPTMRRGGRAIYAFDVSTPTAAGISFKWRKGCFTNSTTDDSNCSSGWSSIGQTWSTPQIGYLEGYSSPVLVFGGGFDTCDDVNSQTRCTSTPRKGANIWFVDANTGAIIRTYSTHYSVPGDVTLVNNADGNIAYVYAGDTGGYLYRINVGTWNGSTIGGNWTSGTAAGDTDIASLSTAGNLRKFMFGPEVVEASGFNAVLIGSGDREHPLQGDYPCSGALTNSFFMIKDVPGDYPASNTLKSELTNATELTCTTANDKGWYFDLPNACEQVVNKAAAVAGVAFFGTNQPVTVAANTCSSHLGVARGYGVKVLTGCAQTGATSWSTPFTGGGMPPSPVTGLTDVDGVILPFCIGCAVVTPEDGATCNSSVCIAEPPLPVDNKRVRTYWYKK